MKWWKVLFLDKVRTYLADVSTRYSSPPRGKWRRTRASSRNVGKISFLPSEVVKKENLSSFREMRNPYTHILVLHVTSDRLIPGSLIFLHEKLVLRCKADSQVRFSSMSKSQSASSEVHQRTTLHSLAQTQHDRLYESCGSFVVWPFGSPLHYRTHTRIIRHSPPCGGHP